jgi:hypothetical protein
LLSLDNFSFGLLLLSIGKIDGPILLFGFLRYFSLGAAGNFFSNRICILLKDFRLFLLQLARSRTVASNSLLSKLKKELSDQLVSLKILII